MPQELKFACAGAKPDDRPGPISNCRAIPHSRPLVGSALKPCCWLCLCRVIKAVIKVILNLLLSFTNSKTPRCECQSPSETFRVRIYNRIPRTDRNEHAMPVCFTCRTLLRRQIDVFRTLRQRRPQSTKNDLAANPRGGEQVPTPNNVPTLNFWQRLGPFTRAAQAYARAQRKRPYVTQICTSLFIYLCSDSTFALRGVLLALGGQFQRSRSLGADKSQFRRKVWGERSMILREPVVR